MKSKDLLGKLTNSLYANVLVSGRAGEGKTLFCLDLVIKYLIDHHKKELHHKTINQLHPLVKGPVPVVFLTSDFPFWVLQKIQQQIFNKPPYNFNPLIHTFNFCKVGPVPQSTADLDSLENFIISRQVKLLVLDSVTLASSANNHNSVYEFYKKLQSFSYKHKVVIVCSQHSYKKANHQNSSASFFTNSQLLQSACLAFNISKINPSAFKLSIIKDRGNLAGAQKELTYERE